MAADNFPDIADPFSLAPQLQYLADNGGVLSPSFRTIPWKQITFLHYKLVLLQDCVNILQQAETLEHCRFYLDHEDHGGLTDETNTLVHSHLRKLVLDGLDNGLDAVLPLLVLPALESVEVDELPEDPDAMLHFLERHESLLVLPALESVEVDELPEDPDAMLHFLERHELHIEELQIHQLLVKSLPQMPILTKLILNTVRVEYTSDVFALLQCPEWRFLPSLEHIHLYRFRSQEREGYETMACALAARWHRSKECADMAQLCSFMIRIRLEDEVIENFEALFSPVTDLEAVGVDIAVKIWGTAW
ncbi:hypothetical protein K438DRAFT_1986167 [Mycena galopus ATCC 62051]|nr:hypothetical protein K438DRAFT_1986167 [Mycena galopus ATCC 62051]